MKAFTRAQRWVDAAEARLRAGRQPHGNEAAVPPLLLASQFADPGRGVDTVEVVDFAGEIAGRTKRIHELCNETMPFVPLWQLDRHMLVSTGLKVFVDDSPSPSPVQVLNPTVLFSNVARWRLE